MLKFRVFEDGRPAERWPIRNAYLLGSDHSAMRGTITFDKGLIVCDKREQGVCALVIQHAVGACGELTVRTCHLPDREEPYVLAVELARHRLMLLYNKLEDWAMFDIGSDHPVARRAEQARKLFIEALCHMTDSPVLADKKAGDALAAAIDGSEELALAHAELLLNRRKSAGLMPRYSVGCGVALDQSNDRLRASLAANFDFVSLPTPWKTLSPEEGDYRLSVLDNWVEWAQKNRVPVVLGPVISFEPTSLPDWLFIWEHDYDTVRDVVYEHVERLVNRYKNSVAAWTVVSGLPINSHFTFTFEQLIDLTRTTSMLVKKVAPSAKVFVEIRQPFGEYFAGNPKSIPPQMYAEQVCQSGINFDALVLRLLMGQAVSGQFTRDLMQISSLLDEWAVFGKPLDLVIGTPSEPVTSEMIAVGQGETPIDPHSGVWRKPWSPVVQSHWMEAVMEIALSKPFVESVAWQEFIDHTAIDLPLSGLVSETMQPKPALRRLASFRRNLATVPPPTTYVIPGSSSSSEEADESAEK
ncbi:MAG: endo-1,4-beta-xylanase [Planctomycetota bacterium]|nr:endo-1,4-beta-xylanase [Planctomycetota bacterium]